MDIEKVSHWVDQIQSVLLVFGLKALGAIAVFIVGRWLIAQVTRGVSAAMTRQALDPTVQHYLVNLISVVLNIILVVAILGYFGVETTSFAALVAGVGVAVGAAWSGLLGNFAAGVFLLVLRPYQVGDYVCVGGIEGTVRELGLFGTAVDTPDNVRTVVGNGKVLASEIRNYSTNPYRRVELTAQLAQGADVHKAMALLKNEVSKVENIMQNPGVVVEVGEFNLMGPVLMVRPHCHTRHYWQVYFDTNKMISDTLKLAGFAAPAQPVRMVG
jgi:small conductance mechanosensitive channel